MCGCVFYCYFMARPVGRGHFVCCVSLVVRVGIGFWVWLGVLKGFPFVCNVAFEAWFVVRSVD